MTRKILILLAPMVLLPLAGCDGSPAAVSAEATPALTVELASPQVESWPQRVAASGHVVPWQEASIGAELGGVRLEEVRVNVGDRVRAGQVLAQFNEDTLRAELVRLDAAVAEARANLDKARNDATRAEQLAASGAVSKSELLQVRTQAAVAEARLQSALAQRDLQSLQLRRARVVAPDDGVISARSATVGAVVNPGTELFRLIRRGRLEWRAQVRAEALPLLRPGAPVSIERTAGAPVEGTLRQVAPSVNPETLTGIVFVDLPPDSGLAAGLFVSGSFALAATDALTLPESALVYREGHRYVMKVDADGRVHQAKVQTGRSQDGRIEIVAGVSAADRVALSGGSFLNEGDRVRVAGQQPAAR